MTNCETSAEVPPVVGTQIRGGIGTFTISTPSNSRMCLSLERDDADSLGTIDGTAATHGNMALHCSASVDRNTGHHLVHLGIGDTPVNSA